MNKFYEVLERDKSKGEQIHILQHQQELKTRVLGYREMELDIPKKIRKDSEEKEAHEENVPAVITYLDGNKGKIPMEDPPQVNSYRQLKTLMQTSQQSKKKLA